MRILIVEDEIRIREGIQKLLSRIGPEYEIVGEANDAVHGENNAAVFHGKTPPHP